MPDRFPPEPTNPTAPGFGFTATACWAWQREWALARKRPQDNLLVLVFHWLVVSLFPFGFGADSALLQRIAPGVFWVCALLATVLWLPRIFAEDAQDGSLEQMLVSGLPVSAVVVGKMAATWVFSGASLALTSSVLGLQFGLNGFELGVLALSMLLGTATMAFLGSILAAMALLARQNPVLIPILTLPLFVPVLIFGSASLEAAQQAMPVMAPLSVLLALALLAITFAPLACGYLLKLAIE